MAARVLAAVISVAVWAGSRLPARVAYGAAFVGGHVEWAARPGKRRRLADNIGRAVGLGPADRRVRRIVRHEVVNEARRSADLLWALGRPDEFAAGVELEGIEHAQAAGASGTGVILLGVHVGGWELATTLPKVVMPVPTTAIVADDWLAWAIGHMRIAVGLRTAYRTAPIGRLGAKLRAGEALIVLGDDASGPQPRTATVEFCGVLTELPAGGVTLARIYQAQLVGFAVVRVGRRRWKAIIDPAIPPPPRRSGDDGDRATLQHFADRWTALVRQYPDQWSANYDIAWPTTP